MAPQEQHSGEWGERKTLSQAGLEGLPEWTCLPYSLPYFLSWLPWLLQLCSYSCSHTVEHGSMLNCERRKKRALSQAGLEGVPGLTCWPYSLPFSVR